MPSFTMAATKTLLGLAVVIAAHTLASGGVAFGDAEGDSPIFADTKIGTVPQDRVNWATGTAFQRQLSEPCDLLLWAGKPLRQAIESLSRARKVAILIDRRVDPSQKLDISLKNVPLGSALQTIAQRRGLGVSRLGSVVYLGPPLAAEHLGAIAAMLEKDIRYLPLAVRRKYHQTQGLAWEDLAAPRELLAELARQGGLEIAGLELVPHDLWAAADLPPMSLTDRLALIAVQFDLAFKVAARGQRVELVRFSDKIQRRPGVDRGVAGSRSMPKPAVTAKTEPPASVEQTRIDKIVIQEKPLGPVLKQLAARLGLELKIDEQAIAAAGISLDQRVSVSIENATIDELFHQLLKSTRLTFHRRDQVVEIVPAE